MNRRHALSGTIMGTLLAGFGRGATSQIANRFVVQSGDLLQDLIVVDATVYALTRRPPKNEYLVCAHSMGESSRLLWQQNLPPALYVGLGLHTDGSPLVHSIGYRRTPTPSHHLLKVDISSGQIDLLSDLTPGSPFHHGGIGKLVRVNEDGGIEELDSMNSRLIPKTIATIEKPINHVCIEPLDSTSVAIVDQRTGRISRVDFGLGAVVEIPFSSPHLANSLAYYDKIEQQHATAQPRLQPQVIAAIGPNPTGGLCLLMSPYKSDGSANVLSISASGANLAVLQIVLADRRSVGIPLKLAWIRNQLAVLFSGGTYILYAV